MLISQDGIRRDILRVIEGADTNALPLMKELLLYGKLIVRLLYWKKS